MANQQQQFFVPAAASGQVQPDTVSTGQLVMGMTPGQPVIMGTAPGQPMITQAPVQPQGGMVFVPQPQVNVNVDQSSIGEQHLPRQP